MLNIKSFTEYLTGKKKDIKEASNTTYKLVDKKTGKVVFTGKYNQVVQKDKETGYKHKVVQEYMGSAVAGQSGPGLGRFRPTVSMYKKSEGTALHKFLVKKGVLKK